MQTYTVFCQEADGSGTTWIEAVEAENLDAAMATGLERCAEAWDMDFDEVRVLGVAKGDVEILTWEDVYE